MGRLGLELFTHLPAQNLWYWETRDLILSFQPKLLSYFSASNIPPPDLGYLGYLGYIYPRPKSFPIIRMGELQNLTPLYSVDATSPEEALYHLEKYLLENLPEYLPPVRRSAWERIVGEDWIGA